MLLKEEFAIILLDVRMPKMDGFKTAILWAKVEVFADLYRKDLEIRKQANSSRPST